MRAVILAAGAATRLRPISDTIPKCLLQVGGQTLLQRSIDALVSYGIRQIIVVVGYRAESVITFCATTYSSETLRCIVNPDYASTNNAYSLLLTEEHILGHDMMLLDGDILFDSRLIGRLLSSRQPDALLLRPNHLLGSEEIKVLIDTNNRVLRISKDINPGDAVGESIGIERFSEPTVRDLFKILRRRIGDEQRVNEWYEASFQDLIDTGAGIFAVDTAGLPCIEIDTAADIKTAEHDVLPRIGV
jgi:choline kinase